MDIGKFKKRSELDEEAWAEWIGTDAKEEPLKHQYGDKQSQKGLDNFTPVVQLNKTHPHAAQKPQVPTQKPPASAPPTISIQIHMPRVRRPKVSIPWRKLRPWLISVCIIGVVLCGGKWAQTKLMHDLRSKSSAAQKVPVVVPAELGYKPLLPPATADNKTGVPKPSYNEQRQLYTFNDIYQGAHITVDQQATPENLKDNQTEVDKLAKNIGATDTFTTTLGIVHSSPVKDSGGQRLVLVNDRMLMFIQSTKALSNDTWATYIQDLQ